MCNVLKTNYMKKKTETYEWDQDEVYPPESNGPTGLGDDCLSDADPGL